MYWHPCCSAVSPVLPLPMCHLGALEVPMMEEAGYEKDFSIAVTVASSCQGLIIRPAITWCCTPWWQEEYLWEACSAQAISRASCWEFSLWSCVISFPRRSIIPKEKSCPFKEALRVTKDTFFAMLAMVIIIGGVSAGFSLPRNQRQPPAFTVCL